MMQSFMGIEPVVGRGDDLSLDLTGWMAMVDTFVPPSDSATAERFQSAMADSGVKFGSVASLKLPEMKDGVVGAFISSERSESHGHLNVGSERVLPENVEPEDVAKSVLPERVVLVERDVPIAPKGMDSVSLWRRGDAMHGQDAVAQSTESKEVPSGQLVNTFVSVFKDMPVEHDVEVGKGVPNELRNVVGNDTRKTEVIITEVGRAVSPKPTKVNDSVVGALIFPKRSESQVQFNVGSEHVLPENVKPADISNRVLPAKGEALDVAKSILPEKAVLVERDVPIAPKGMDSVSLWRRGDATHGQDVTAQSTKSNEVPSAQPVSPSAAVSKAMSVEHDVEVGKSAPNEVRNVNGDDTRKTEVIITEVGRAVSPKPTEVNDSVVGALIFPKQSESQVQFNVGSEHVLLENVKPADVSSRVLPEKGETLDVAKSILPEKTVLVGRDGGAALQNQEGMPVRRQGDGLSYQNIVKAHQMPSDGNEPVQVIAPAPLPIELPAVTVQQQSAAAVATHDVVKMFVAAAEAVADAILVSSGFENGEGRILVRLQPEVLGGSEVQITAKGGTLTIVVNPASQDVQTVVEANRTQFEQYLAEKVHSWRIAVAVKKGDKTDERV